MRKPYPFAALVAFALGAIAPAAQALDTSVSERLGIVAPYTGSYFDPAQSGSGLEVDIGPGLGNFISFQTYDAAGNQVNYLLQAAYTPTTEQERAATGIIGRATGEFLQARDGQCPGCEYRQPQLTATGLHATLEWSDPRHVKMTLDNAAHSTYQWQAVNFESRDEDAFLPGLWAATVYVDNKASNPGKPEADFQTAAMALVKLTALPAGTKFLKDPDAPASYFIPPAGARLYRLDCPADSLNQNGTNRGACWGAFSMLWAISNDAVAWYDPATKRAGIEAARLVDGNYVIGKKDATTDRFAMHFDLYLGPDVLRARGVFETDKVRQQTRAATFVRLPEGTTRYPYDYFR
jgi:hypothetical protein